MTGGDGIRQNLKLKERIGEGLHAETRRARTRIAKSRRDGITFAHETLHDANADGAIPRTCIELVVVFRVEHGAVARLDSYIVRRGRILELWLPLIGGEAEADPDCTGVVDAEPAG